MDRNCFVRSLWAAKLAKRITPNAYLIGRTMLRRANRKGALWPSLDTLATDIGCCARTAGRAVAALRQAGLLMWETRRAAWNRRDSNLYQLVTPQPVEKKEKNQALSLPPTKCLMGPQLAGALARLGALLGVDDPMPWLRNASRGDSQPMSCG